MKKIVIIILFLGIGPSITGSSFSTNENYEIVSTSLENITPLRQLSGLEVVNIINKNIL
jgi:hypothetical protein